MSSHQNAFLLTILVILFLGCHSITKVQVYPLTNEKFDHIYRINNGSHINYLHISCKEKNTISVSYTPTLGFVQHPRFPVFGNIVEQDTPRMQRSIYTFLSNCPVDAEVHGNNTPNELIVLRRKNNGSVLMKIKTVSFSDKYNKIVTEDNSMKWGMGQRFQRRFAIKDGMWTVWNRDRPFEIDNGLAQKSAQTYGHQPVYLARNHDSQMFHMVYFKNTFGFNLEVNKNSSEMIYHSVGGNVHFIVMLGDKHPEKLIRHYHDYIGRIHIPPFWALGWHQSRWGYQSLDVVREVVNRYNTEEIPLDIIWSDLDYMQDKAIFTLDEKNFPAKKFRQFLIEENLHWIPLIDVGLHIQDYSAASEGINEEVFLKNQKEEPYVGKVWPGQVYFVDYLHPAADSYWQNQLNRLYQKVPFSGIWLDMNEPSNFDGNRPVYQTYRIQHTESINMMTIDADLKHHCQHQQKCENGFFEHREVHAYYGHLSTIPTYKFLKQYGRPFIISRSNSVGTGRFAGHWTGDNNADWDFLRLSISGNFLFQIFGVQMVGADICGFHFNTEEELCSRWMQLGSLYPFARSHNENQSKSQEPYQLGKTLLDTSKLVLKNRYSMLKQTYTYLIDLNGTGSLFRPLFFQFFDDIATFEEKISESQFLLGKGLMSTPILQKGSENRSVYFPGERQIWYDITEVSRDPHNKDKNIVKVYKGKTKQIITNKLPAPIPLFLRGGFMILTNQPKLRTKDIDNNYQIIAGLCSNFTAQGSIMGINDYHSELNIEKCLAKGCLVKFTIEKTTKANNILLKWVSDKVSEGQITISKIKIFDNQRTLSYNQAPIYIKGSGEKTIEMIEQTKQI